MENDTQIAGLLTIIEAARKSHVEHIQGGTVVFTNGVFDVLHRGHLEYLKQARALGTMLIVGLNADASVRRIKGAKRPLVLENDRALALLAMRFVDAVVLFDQDTPLELIEAVNPHMLVKGGDYRAEDVVGYDHVTHHGGRVVTIPLCAGYSTSKLIETVTERYC